MLLHIVVLSCSLLNSCQALECIHGYRKQEADMGTGMADTIDGRFSSTVCLPPCNVHECIHNVIEPSTKELSNRRIHTQERLRFPSQLKYQDFLRLSRQAEISRLSPSGIILLTELHMPHIEQEYNPCPCFDTLAWNDGIENTKIICSSVHTSAAMQIITLIPK